MHSRLLGIVCVLLAHGFAGAATPLRLQVPDPTQFRVTVFASGLNYPKGMARLSDGSLLVATSDPNPGSKGFYSSKGALVRLVDADSDGVADGPPQALASGFPGSLSGLRVQGKWALVCSVGNRISVFRLGATPDTALELVGSLRFELPSPWLHPPSDLEVVPLDTAVGSFQLYFQLGSQSNIAPTSETAGITGFGLTSAPLLGDSIYRIELREEANALVAAGPERIAMGLRNSAGFAWEAVTGDLYFQDNGIDGLSNPNEPHSTDELNVIREGALGGATVEDFGFPSTYVAYRTGKLVGNAGIQPLVVFQPKPDPLTGSESEGPAEIALAPSEFPGGLNYGIFVGFHGKFSLGGIANEENPLLYVDLETFETQTIVGNDEPGVGHLDGLLATEDSLFVADLCSSGSVSTGIGEGVIYQIQAVPLVAPRFIRGDASSDGTVQVDDAVVILEHLFREGPASACLDSEDANDDTQIDISDPVAVLFFLFAAGVLPSPQSCGLDPTLDDSLPCASTCLVQ